MHGFNNKNSQQNLHKLLLTYMAYLYSGGDRITRRCVSACMCTCFVLFHKHGDDTTPSRDWKIVCRKVKYKIKQINNADREANIVI